MALQLTVLAIATAIALYWVSADAAHTLARDAAAAACRRAGVQLLDQTVSLSKLRIVRGDFMLALRRSYRFEYSPDGVNRLAAQVSVLGNQAYCAEIAPPQAVVPLI